MSEVKHTEKTIREINEILCRQIADFKSDRDILYAELCKANDRIRKAREILTVTIPQSQLALEIIRAVEALEGK